MRYQHLKTTKKTLRYIIPVLPLIVASLLIVYRVEMPQSLRNVGLAGASPFWKMRDIFLRSGNSNEKMLKEEINSLRRETVSVRALENDTRELRELLGRSQEEVPMISASVIHSNSYSPYDTFIIDRGAENGVREGMLIVTSEHIAVGYAKAVYNKMTIVSLFSAPDATFDAILVSTSSTHTILTGYGAGTLKTSIPRDIEVDTNTTVILPTFKTYVIGTVASIEVAPEDAYKNIYVHTPVNMYGLRFVLVDTGSIWNMTRTEDNEPTESESGE